MIININKYYLDTIIKSLRLLATQNNVKLDNDTRIICDTIASADVYDSDMTYVSDVLNYLVQSVCDNDDYNEHLCNANVLIDRLKLYDKNRTIASINPTLQHYVVTWALDYNVVKFDNLCHDDVITQTLDATVSDILAVLENE